MRVTITKGANPCQHVRIANAATGRVLAIVLLSDLRAGRPDIGTGDPYDAVTRLRAIVHDAIDRGVLTGASTMAQIKTYIEGLEI